MAREAKVALKSLKCIVSLEGQPRKFITLKQDDFSDQSWARLLEQVKLNAKDPTLKFDVEAFVCPVERGGCGKVRVLDLQNNIDDGVMYVVMRCIGCGKGYRLKGKPGTMLEFVKTKKKAEKPEKTKKAE